MKPTYQGFEAKKAGGFISLPPVGAYVAQINGVVLKTPDGDKQKRTVIELYLDITEGEYAGRFMEVYEDQKERFGDNVSYKGIFRLTPPVDGDEDWRKRAFEGAMWCIEQSNPNYAWDWDEKKLKLKKVGISVRRRLYTSNGKDRETFEIGRLETVDDVRNGVVKPMNDRDQREQGNPVPEAGGYTAVDDPDVPWG